MNEERIQAYGNLIQQLLSCPDGEEPQILQDNSELVDLGFVQVCEAKAAGLAEEGKQNEADFLRSVARQIGQFLFIQELWQAEQESNSDEAVISMLEQQQHLLDARFAEILQQGAEFSIAKQPEAIESILRIIENLSIHINNFRLGKRANNIEIAITGYKIVLKHREPGSEKWAGTQNNLAVAYYYRIKGERAENIEKAIEIYNQALTVRTRDAFPEKWAGTQNNLANAYLNRIRGERAENLEQAIAYYTAALTVYTRDAFPEDWAQTQNNLANAYLYRIRGERAENLERAIEIYTQALTVRTRDAFPEDWAETQHNLATAYCERIRGEKAKNLERAIEIYTQALTVETREAFPEYWAQTQNNLANAYYSRIRGKRADNIERAIEFYTAALTFYTREAFPEDWARTQHNLATAYSDRIRGERAENIERAIEFYNQALTVYTCDAFPEDWARTQNNLAAAYSNRIREERAENIERAIEFYNQALTVYTREAFPEYWAQTQHNLGEAYRNRIRGERAENIERAIEFCTQALTVRTREAFPQDWAMTQHNLANAYSDRIRGKRAENIDKAIEFYTQVLIVYTRDAFPEDWAMTQNSLATAYSDRIRGERADNIEQAIKFCTQALTVYTRDAFPEDWARTQNNLANAYLYRIRGERAENIEQAIEFCTQALTVRTRDAFPEDWAGTQNNLANAYRNRIRGERAENLERAIEFYTQALTVYTREAFPQNYTETLFNLGNLYQNLYQSNQKWQLAYDTFSKAIETVEFLRGEIQSGDESKQKLAEEYNRIYLAMVEVCIQLQRYTEAVEYAERSKAQNLIELLSVKDLYPKGEIPPQVRQELQQLRLRIAQENQRLKQAKSKNYDLINQLRQDLAAKYPYTPLNFGEIKQLADEKTAIVEWYILADSFCVFIITNDNSQPKILSFPKSELDKIIDWTNQYLGDYYPKVDENLPEEKRFEKIKQLRHEKWEKPLGERLKNLAELLHIDEILKSIPETCDQLILIPHRYLHLFPLHALPISRESWQRFHPNHPNCPPNPYLIDCFDDGVRYTPSCQLLHKVQQQPERLFDSLLAIQTPTKDLYDKDYGVVDAIKQQFKAPVVIKKNQAKKSALLKLNESGKTDANPQLQTTNSLFFYCHGYFNSNSPLDSGLQLADGNLTLADIIAHFDLKNCRLVTMSACETGFTDFNSNSDEYIGLPSGFMLAGSHNIIGSLWTVSALATSLLMTKFHEELQQSNNIALALNKSQKWLRDVTIKGLQDWLPKSQLEDVWQEELAAILKERENNPIGANDQPLNSPFYWSAFCAIGKGF
ncbi:MAG: tetratricopeptide repeat protein [Phormidium sp.]